MGRFWSVLQAFFVSIVADEPVRFALESFGAKLARRDSRGFSGCAFAVFEIFFPCLLVIHFPSQSLTEKAFVGSKEDVDYFKKETNSTINRWFDGGDSSA